MFLESNKEQEEECSNALNHLVSAQDFQWNSSAQNIMREAINNMAFEETKTRDESLIPNSQIETMFLRIANDDQMKKYVDLVEHGHQALATAYASNAVYRVFFALVERYGGNIEDLKKGKNVK